MGVLEIALIAIGLSMDAFAISIMLGLSITSDTPVKNQKLVFFLIPGLYFGFFQALMPFIGYSAGTVFAQNIQDLDHWIAFALLGFIGGKMIKDSFSKEEETKLNGNPFQFFKMLLLAIATSIDALAVGITLSFFQLNIFIAILIIGLTTFCISSVGVRVGNIFGSRFKSKAEFFGGAVLIMLGLKILIEHLFFISH